MPFCSIIYDVNTHSWNYDPDILNNQIAIIIQILEQSTCILGCFLAFVAYFFTLLTLTLKSKSFC